MRARLRTIPVAVAALASLAVVAAPSASQSKLAAFSWAGSWQSDQGTLTLTETGTLVTGSFGTGGHVRATASSIRLGGTWSGTLKDGLGKRVTGSGTFSLAATGGDRFFGTWRGGGSSGTWSGTRVGAPAPSAGTAIPFSFSASCASNPCNNALYTAETASGSGTIALTAGGVGGGSGTAHGTATLSVTGNPNASGINATSKTGSGKLTFTQTKTYQVSANGDKTILIFGSVSGSGSCAGSSSGSVSISVSGGATSFQIFACGNTYIWASGRDHLTVSVGK